MEALAGREPFDRDDLVAVRLRGQHEAGADERRRRGARSTSRTRPARTRSSSRAGRAARAARRGGSRPPRRPPRARSPLTVSSILMRQHPLERAPGQHAQRVAAVRRRPADVVDRARRLGDPVGERVGLLDRRPHEPGDRARPTRTRRAARRSRAARASTTAITIALRGPTFMNVSAPAARDAHGDDQLVGRERRSASGPTRKSSRATASPRARSRARPRRPPTSSGGSASPAGEAVPRFPPIVPRFRICGEPTVREASASAGSALAERPSSTRCRSGRRRAAASAFSRHHPRSSATSLGSGAPRAGRVEVELDHHVGAALDRHRVRDAPPSARAPRRACVGSARPRGQDTVAGADFLAASTLAT